MQYRPQLVDDKQSQNATLEEKSQLLTDMEEVRVQDEQKQDRTQQNLQMTNGIFICVIQSRTKRQNVPSVQPKLAAKS